MTPPRTATLRIAAVLLAMLVLGMLALLIHPVLFTGRYYEFTVKKVKYEDDGMVTLIYDDVLTYGTEVKWTWRPATFKAESVRYSWEEKPPGFLRWPRKSRDQSVGFVVAQRNPQDPLQRLMLKEGATYRMRAGEWINFIETTLPDGRIWPSELGVETTP